MHIQNWAQNHMLKYVQKSPDRILLFSANFFFETSIQNLSVSKFPTAILDSNID